MAREVMRRHASDNEYLHKDFHGALSCGIEYLHEIYGEDAVRRYLHDFALSYYTPLRRELNEWASERESTNPSTPPAPSATNIDAQGAILGPDSALDGRQRIGQHDCLLTVQPAFAERCCSQPESLLSDNAFWGFPEPQRPR